MELIQAYQPRYEPDPASVFSSDAVLVETKLNIAFEQWKASRKLTFVFTTDRFNTYYCELYERRLHAKIKELIKPGGHTVVVVEVNDPSLIAYKCTLSKIPPPIERTICNDWWCVVS